MTWFLLIKQSAPGRKWSQTKLLSRRKLKFNLSQNFYFEQVSSNIRWYETTRNTSQLTGVLGAHSIANSSWQAHKGPALWELGAPWEAERSFPLAGKPSGHTCS